MEVIFLPAWANITAIIAIITLCVALMWGKVNKTSYSILSGAVAVGLATYLLATAEDFCALGVTTSAGVVLFLALVVAAIAMGLGEHPASKVLKVVIPITIGCIMLTTLLYSNTLGAAIWLAVVGFMFFAGYLLYRGK